jgi:putative transposase
MPFFHVWFATKGRKWLLQGEVLDAARLIIAQVAAEKHINLIESEAIVDHVHLLLELKDKSELSNAMMLIKGVSARRLLEQFPTIRLDAHTASFWQAGCGSTLVPPSAVTTIRSYIRTQWDRLDDYVR